MKRRIAIITLILVLFLLMFPLLDMSRFLIGLPENGSDDSGVSASDGYGEGPYNITIGPFKAYSHIDQHERAVKYVRLRVETPEGDVYIERTDQEGYAYFLEMPFEEFPNGSIYSVRSFTFTDPAWEHGEEIPVLENDYWEYVTFSSIVYLIPIVIFCMLFLITRIRL